MAPPDTDVAVLAASVAKLTDVIVEIHNNAMSNSLLVERVSSLTTKVDKVVDDHETRLRDLETATTQFRERMTLWQIGQGVYATVASVVAAAIGRTRAGP